jgi:uncharacterized protein (TIGR03437 family)
MQRHIFFLILFAATISTSSAQPADPIWLPGSSQKVCQLVGEQDRQIMQPTLSRTETNYGLIGNDLGSSFEHNGKLWFLFGDSHPTAAFNGKPNSQTDAPRLPLDNDAVGFTSGTNIDQCVKLDFVRDSIGAYQNPVVLNAAGKPAITLGVDEVPIAGVDVGGRMFVVFGTDNNVAMPTLGNLGFSTRSVLAVSDDDGNTYHYLYDLSAPPCTRCDGAKFVNVAIAKATDGYIYFWGSGGGTGYRNSSVFLARKLATGIAQAGGMQYFTGVAKDGTPNFSAAEADASALFQDYNGANNSPANCTGELGVEFNQSVQRWVMLYNCLNKTAANLNGIYMRFAPQPWGPWGAPQTIFNGLRDKGICFFIHRAVTPTSPACDQVGDPGREDVQGGSYGPYFLSRFTTGTASGTSTFYYTMSTWNPYVQVIMKSTIQVPNASTVNAASFDASALSSGAIASLFGTGLSDSTAATPSTNLPTTLAGVSVTVQDNAGTSATAPLFFVSAGQINFLVPPNLANGPATVTVVKNSSPVATSAIQLAAVAPALFTANSNGKGVAAAYFSTAANPTIFAFTCGSTAGSCVSAPFDIGTTGGAVLVLYGTGIRNNSGLSTVKVTIGGIAATPVYAGPQNQFPGLDQINVPVPASLAGKGEVDVVLAVNGTVANTVRVAFK